MSLALHHFCLPNWLYTSQVKYIPIWMVTPYINENLWTTNGVTYSNRGISRGAYYLPSLSFFLNNFVHCKSHTLPWAWQTAMLLVCVPQNWIQFRLCAFILFISFFKEREFWLGSAGKDRDGLRCPSEILPARGHSCANTPGEAAPPCRSGGKPFNWGLGR